MCLYICKEIIHCRKENMIPDQVLIDILRVYEFRVKDDIKKIPNDLIYEGNGNFWTTWSRIFEIRSGLKK